MEFNSMKNKKITINLGGCGCLIILWIFFLMCYYTIKIFI